MVTVMSGNIVDYHPSGTLLPSADASGNNVSLGVIIHYVSLHSSHHVYIINYLIETKSSKITQVCTPPSLSIINYLIKTKSSKITHVCTPPSHNIIN